LGGRGPVLQRRRPLLLDVPSYQIYKLHKGHITGERSLGLGHLPYLPMEALHGVGGVDDLPDGGRVFEVAR